MYERQCYMKLKDIIHIRITETYAIVLKICFSLFVSKRTTDRKPKEQSERMRLKSNK